MGGQVRSYGGKSALERAAARRERLVAATITVFAEHGEHTTMTRICAEAGLTERYFYESFPGRDDALLAALDSICEEIAALVVTTVDNTAGTPEDRVHAMMGAFVGLVTAEPAKGQVAVVHSNSNPRLRARRHELIGMFADLAAREAAELYGEEAWPPDRARIHGLVYIAGFAELVGSWLTGDVTMSAEELVDTAGRLFTAVTRREA